MGNLWGKAVGLVKGVFIYWNKPAKGRYVANKEIVAYSVGGMGVQFIAAIVGLVALNANCLLLGSIFGLTAFELTTIMTINTVISLVIQPLKSYWIDNVGGKKGKARPFLLWFGFPSAILFALVPFIPLTWGHSTILILVGVIFIIANFVYTLYSSMYIQLSQLMTPNTTERSDIISISSIIYSFAPTLTGFFFPLISKFFGEGAKGQLEIGFYQVIFPVFALIGAALGLLSYYGTKERIIVPKAYQSKVKFKDGFKEIASNKYFWIINVGTWVVFARGAITACLNWAYIYVLQDSTIQAFVTLLMGTASGIGMAITPLLVRKFGKRTTVIFANIVSAAASSILIFVPSSFTAFAISMYVMFFAGAVQIITAPAMNAEALDYQQWKSGSRLEGFAGNFAIIGSIIGLGTNYIVPAVYSSYGLTGNYDVLYDEAIRNPIFRMLAIISTIGGIVFIIPYIFWDLSEKKHGIIMEELKIRAIDQNKLDGVDDGSFLSSDEIMENMVVESKEELEKEFAAEGINADGTFSVEEDSIVGKMKKASDDINNRIKKNKKDRKKNLLDKENNVNENLNNDIESFNENIDSADNSEKEDK